MPDSYHNKGVCVTGGAGFIGSHLVEALVNRGAHVRIIDDLSTGEMENLSAIASQIQFTHASILDANALKDAFSDVDVVFHHAAIASVPQSMEQPARYFEVNTTGTVRVLEAARTLGVKRIVYAASSSAYGESDVLPKTESMQSEPISPYASSKLASEVLLHTYCHCYDLSGVSLRYFNIFGPRQRADSPYAAVIPKFIDSLQSGKKPTIFGDGKQTRDFTHVANAVHACLLAGESSNVLNGQIVNVACGQSFSLLQLLETIAKHMDVPAECEFAPPRAGDVQDSLADVSAAKALLGYEPVVEFDEGLKRTIEWWSANVA